MLALNTRARSPAFSAAAFHFNGSCQCLSAKKRRSVVAGGPQMGEIVRDVLNPPENVVVEPGHFQGDSGTPRCGEYAEFSE